MFDSLEEQMKKDEDRVSTKRERMMRYALYAIIGVALFIALIFAIHLMS
jgi:hypothetical protein